MRTPVTSAPPLTIEPIYDDAIDLTASWAERTHGDIFPAVYRRYRAPQDAQEAEAQIDDLAAVICAINAQYDQARAEAIGLGLDPNRDRPTKDKLKAIRTARNRHEAIRRAYIHWLAQERGEPQLLPSMGTTQYSAKARVELLGASLLTLLDLYLADVEERLDPQVMHQQLTTLRQQLGAVFMSTEAAETGNTEREPIA
jgi:hypothetical protein